MKQKIYDCFTFFNELDLLELRLEELYDTVDYFVICEADRNFSGEKKEYFLEKNIKRYSKYSKKMIYLKVTIPPFDLLDKSLIKLISFRHIPKFGTNSLGLNGIYRIFSRGKWNVINKQRNFLKKGLKGIKERDILLFSDLDEIPNKERIKNLRTILNKQEVICFKNKLFFYYLNGLAMKEKLDWIKSMFIFYI